MEKYGKIVRTGRLKKMKKIFYALAVIGVMIITIIAFTVPKDPYAMIPSILFIDKPIWFCITFFGSFLYLIVLGIIYNKIEKKFPIKK